MEIHKLRSIDHALCRFLMKSSTVWRDGPGKLKLSYLGVFPDRCSGSITPRRGEIPSEKVFLTEHSTLYSAKSCPSSKRSASLGPFHSDDDYLPRNHPHPPLRSLSTQPRVPHRNSSEYNRWTDPPIQENMTSMPLDSVASPPLSPFYTPPYTPQYSTMELPIISRPDTPIDYVDSSFNRLAMGIQENHHSREPSQVSTDDSAAGMCLIGPIQQELMLTPTSKYYHLLASMNLSNLSPTRYYTSSSSGHSSRITFTMSSPPISRSVSRDHIHSYNRTASPSPNPSTVSILYSDNCLYVVVKTINVTLRSPAADILRDGVYQI